MKKSTHFSLFCLGTLTILTSVTLDAQAKCQRMGFLVNDYGKEGPTKDAKDLLDKHVAKWATENKIAKFTMGKKEVSCELFLNFIVFDEHTQLTNDQIRISVCNKPQPFMEGINSFLKQLNITFRTDYKVNRPRINKLNSQKVFKSQSSMLK